MCGSISKPLFGWKFVGHFLFLIHFLPSPFLTHPPDYGDPSESRVSAKRGAANAGKKKASGAKAAAPAAPVMSSPAPAVKKAAGSGSGSGGKLILGSGSKITLGGSKIVLGGGAKAAAENPSAGMCSEICLAFAVGFLFFLYKTTIWCASHLRVSPQCNR